jgi:hypothetical protein
MFLETTLRAGTATRSRALRTQICGSAIALALAGGAAVHAEAADFPGSFRGDAYATFANVKAGIVAAQLGRSADQGCPCEGTDGKTLSNEVDSLRAGKKNGDVLKAKVTRSTVYTTATQDSGEIRNTSRIAGLNAFGGLITADAIEAVADVSATSNTMTASSTGSTFVNLVIAGQQIAASVPENTRIALPGIGTVTLNKVTDTGQFKKSGRILVEMITIDVSDRNGFGLAVGSEIVVAHALAGISRTQPPVVFNGQAYAAAASGQAGDDLENKIGKAAAVSMGCDGTSGKTKTNNINTLDAGNLLSVGDGTTSVFGGPEGAPDVSKTTATVNTLNLLNGLITGSEITAVAQQSIQDGSVTSSTTGSGFASLSVAGVSIPLDTPPNTKIVLPGIGNVIVNEQVVPQQSGPVRVNGLHIVVTTENTLGLPVGSEIVVAHADAEAAPF